MWDWLRKWETHDNWEREWGEDGEKMQMGDHRGKSWSREMRCEGCKAMMNRRYISFFCEHWLECQISPLLIIEHTGLAGTLLTAVVSPWQKCHWIIIFTYSGLFGSMLHLSVQDNNNLKKKKKNRNLKNNCLFKRSIKHKGWVTLQPGKFTSQITHH